jgi:hypothetical protein
MIDRFYAKYLTAEMNVALIQSQREGGKKKQDEELKVRVRAKKLASHDAAPTKQGVKKTT